MVPSVPSLVLCPSARSRLASWFLWKRELWKCLHTVSYQKAKLRAAVWEGNIARLFLHLQQHQHNMTPEQIKRLAQQYIPATLDECEETRRTRTISDDERDAISLALTDALE